MSFTDYLQNQLASFEKTKPHYAKMVATALDLKAQGKKFNKKRLNHIQARMLFILRLEQDLKAEAPQLVSAQEYKQEFQDWILQLFPDTMAEIKTVDVDAITKTVESESSNVFVKQLKDPYEGLSERFEEIKEYIPYDDVQAFLKKINPPSEA